MFKRNKFSATIIQIVLAISAFLAFTRPFGINYIGFSLGLLLLVIAATRGNKIFIVIISALSYFSGVYFRFKHFSSFTELKPEELNRYLSFNDELSPRYLLIGLVLLSVVFVTALIFEKKDKLNLRLVLTAKMISYISMLVAIATVIDIIRIGDVGAGSFIVIFSGYLLGPAYGFMVGAITDTLSFILKPSIIGSFNPIFTLIAGLQGMLPAIILILLGNKNNEFKLVKVFFSLLIPQIILIVIIQPIVLNILYKLPLYYFMLKALLRQVFAIPIYSFLYSKLYKTISKRGGFDDRKLNEKRI